MPEQQFDVVVIGSGAGAAALLQPLLRRKLKVLVLERGLDVEPDRAPSEAAVERGRASPTALTNVVIDARGALTQFAIEGSALGGGTVIYTGNVLRFFPDDFRRRTVLGDIAGAQVADWPLTYEDLAPYYDEMEAEMGVAGDAAANPFEPPRTKPYPLPAVPMDRAGELAARAARELGWHPFSIPTVASPASARAACTRCGLCSGFLCTANARWSARTGLLEAAATGGVTLRLGATALRIVTDASGRRADTVEFLDERGALERVRGTTIVLAAGAIQTARVLLASTSAQHPSGLANRSDQVGRNLMTHVNENFLTVGHVPGAATHEAAGCTLAIQDFYDPKTSGVALPITLEPRAIGSFAAFSALVSGHPGWRALDDATLRARHRDHIVVLTMIEDLPRAENRVRLHPTLRDPLGQPVPVVEYASHPLDLEAAAVGAARARELLARAGARDIVSISVQQRLHLMGTCRMGDDPTTSVVDRDGRAHDLDNLYVADASLFVTSAGVNPSLTVQALARRIGEHLAQAPQ